MMKCFVYKSLKKADTYIYINQKDNFEKIPQKLLLLFGKLELTIEFELTVERKLAFADTNLVIKSLNEQGYYLQMPSI